MSKYSTIVQKRPETTELSQEVFPFISDIPDSILKDIESRVLLGEKKYGSRLKTNNTRDSLVDCYQEALDGMMYSKQAELEGKDDGELYNSFSKLALTIKNMIDPSIEEGDLPYLAGLIDGEGSVGARISKDGNISSALTIVNTDRHVLEWAKKTTGVGSVLTRKRYGDNKKPTFVWTVSLQPGAKVLKQVMPYLKIKKLQAQLFCTLAAMGRIPLNKRASIPEFKKRAQNITKLIIWLKKVPDKQEEIK